MWWTIAWWQYEKANEHLDKCLFCNFLGGLNSKRFLISRRECELIPGIICFLFSLPLASCFLYYWHQVAMISRFLFPPGEFFFLVHLSMFFLLDFLEILRLSVFPECSHWSQCISDGLFFLSEWEQQGLLGSLNIGLSRGTFGNRSCAAGMVATAKNTSQQQTRDPVIWCLVSFEGIVSAGWDKF